MQTFLPYPDFQQSAECLDYRRLGKQRVEAVQILNALRGIKKEWVNHPAVRMWRGHEPALSAYFNVIREEWIARGYNNNMEFIYTTESIVMPPWFGDPTFHASHRSNLLRKDPVFYGKYNWSEPPTLEYVWPV
jgi:hypothetical protein